MINYLKIRSRLLVYHTSFTVFLDIIIIIKKSSENEKKKSSENDQSELFIYFFRPLTLNLKKNSRKLTNTKILT